MAQIPAKLPLYHQSRMSQTSFSQNESEAFCFNFIKNQCSIELDTIIQSKEVHRHYSIHISLMELANGNPQFFIEISNNLNSSILLFDAAAVKVQEEILQDNPSFSGTVKNNVHTRIKDCPILPNIFLNRFPRTEDLKRLTAITGTVIRTGIVKMMETFKIFECSNCKNTQKILADDSLFGLIGKPSVCQGNMGKGKCNSTKFNDMQLDQSQQCIDYQEIKIQENLSKVSVGRIPGIISIVLKHDLVDKAKAGDKISIFGYGMKRWKPLKLKEKCDCEIVILANYIDIQSETLEDSREEIHEFENVWNATSKLDARNEILKALCPHIYGLYLVKLGILVTILGGVAKYDGGGLKIRGEGHLLLAGDPGTAKSQLLKFASKLCSRSVMTTGIGTTNAGLTVTAVRDGSDWQLEAGALVLADGGVCCIDEFTSIKESDRTSIHEAMEQQTLSVAKAGLVCKLDTRCSILAACNAKGRYDSSQNLSINLALASPLLSRFDLIFVIPDLKKPDWDRRVADTILSNSTGTASAKVCKSFWSLDRLVRFIKKVKVEFQPALTSESSEILMRYYQLQRQADLRNSARTTVRLLESLVRLSQGHAKLMCHERVEIIDAVFAIVLMECSFDSQSVCDLKLDVMEAFPADADENYQITSKFLLIQSGKNLAKTWIEFALQSIKPSAFFYIYLQLRIIFKFKK